VRIKSLLTPAVAAIVVLVVALALAPHRASSSGAPSSEVAHGKRTKVKVFMFAFEPASLTVRVGTRVTFTNRDQTAHTATADAGSFDTGTIPPDGSRSIVLRHPGTYLYHCAFHAFMTATIKVVG